ncbi:MAG: glutamine amidotransferase [Myxococcota bacterium]
MSLDILLPWLLPEADPSLYNDWTLSFDSSLGVSILLSVAVLVLLSLLASAWGLRRISAARRTPLLLLRVGIAALVLLYLLEPAIELRAVSPVRSKTLVLFDDSESMALTGPDGETRWSRVRDHVQTNEDRFVRLQSLSNLESFRFSDAVQPVEGLPPALTLGGTKSDFARLLEDLAWQAQGRDLGAVVVYSDGADTEGVGLEEIEAAAGAVDAPIHVVGFGYEDAAPDLAVKAIRADDFAFVHNTVKMEVEIEARGLSTQLVPVTLKRGGSVLETKEARIGGGSVRVVFEFKPKEVGKEVYGVSVPIQPEEAVTSNNAKSIVLRVIRDRIRVLQVAGRPSWDVRFLRELLEQNPNIDLISFFILRSTTDVQKAAQDELALIPFPVNDLFTTELETFDVVIYQNFTYRPYRMAHYLRNIRQYVLDGGSFLMVGGDQSFEPGWYAGTPIADILPVRLGGALGWDEADYAPRLTDEGRQHPITRIGPPGLPPSTAYARLPALSGANGSLGLVPGARALLVHPSLPGNPPLVSIRDVGRGRSMAVATDSSWFWRFVAVGEEGRAGREYDRFWNQSLRWLIRDPALSRLRLSARHPVVYKGEPVQADVTVLGVDYRGLEGAEVQAQLVPFDTRTEGRSTTLRTGAAGTAVLEFEDVEPGTYVMRAEASDENERLAQAEEPVIVEASEVERRSPFPRPQLLEAMAKASGGSFTRISEPLPELELEEARRVEVDRSRVVPLWDGFPFLLLLTALLGLEWWLRRRAGAP